MSFERQHTRDRPSAHAAASEPSGLLNLFLFPGFQVVIVDVDSKPAEQEIDQFPGIEADMRQVQ
jgi:hypothetical protein